ncbi:MAG TPA: Rieske 2Fe-2S domain-containing protein [Candidatus Dormibacteraeota bacterium]|nr:Rieske 2Fe-2S domain-containing protein [Candidatus Dormibacteraeota bacterium]
MEIDSRRVRKLINQNRSKERLLDRTLRSLVWLDPVAEGIQKAVGAFYEVLGRPGQAIKNVMHGTTALRHPLHPALTDVPVGAWTLGILADWLFIATGRVPAVAGDLALAVGLAGAILSALTGLTDFHETFGHERRTAVLHGLVMTSVVVVEIASLALRLSVPSMRLLAIVLSTIAWLVLLFGAYVGGHLTFGIGSAVNHNAFSAGPTDFVRVGTRDDFPEGEMRRVEAAGLPVVILRRNGLLHAMGAVCSHAGGPLNEGKLDDDVVTCPWHYSKFCFTDARVAGGPATFDQPALITRERGGIVEVKLAYPHE